MLASLAPWRSLEETEPSALDILGLSQINETNVVPVHVTARFHSKILGSLWICACGHKAGPATPSWWVWLVGRVVRALAPLEFQAMLMARTAQSLPLISTGSSESPCINVQVNLQKHKKSLFVCIHQVGGHRFDISLETIAIGLEAIASRLGASLQPDSDGFNLVAMAFNLIAMASNPVAMACLPTSRIPSLPPSLSWKTYNFTNSVRLSTSTYI